MIAAVRGLARFDKLDVRLVALLGIALLPIGIIAMVQTYRVIEEANANFDQALLNRMSQAIDVERDAILRAREAARVSSFVVPGLLGNPNVCSNYFENYAVSDPEVQFAGYVDRNGIVRCGSAGVGRDMSATPLYQQYADTKGPAVSVRIGTISNAAVIILAEPVRQGSTDLGYVAISVNQPVPDVNVDDDNRLNDPTLVIFDETGTVLAGVSSGGEIAIDDVLPQNRTLASLVGGGSQTLHAKGVDGQRYVYSIVQLIDGQITALAAWPENFSNLRGFTATTAILFPLLMWVVSIAVAYFAIHRLVIRHIGDLRRRIWAFTSNRRIMPLAHAKDTPNELKEVTQTFHQMTERIVRDEAELENSLHEKDVLLKEVHHRVKNNLQLIASMMNMQLRKSTSPETQMILRRLQDRVLGLAAVHRNLYQATALSRVNAGQLLAELSRDILNSADDVLEPVKISTHFDDTDLYPDQAVPLALLMSEALTGALKHLGVPSEGHLFIDVSLTADDDLLKLQIANSTGRLLIENAHTDSSGLGPQLMDAFVMQLNGRMDIQNDGDQYKLTIEFERTNFSSDSP